MKNDLVIRIEGSVQESNLEQYRAHWLEQIEAVNTNLVTDDDFATAIKQVKQFKDAEEKLDLAKHYCLEQNADISTLFSMINEISGKLKITRLDLNRKVEEKKKSRKDVIIKSGSYAVNEFMAGQHAAVKQMEIDHLVFSDVAKGKRSLKSMQDSVNNAAAELIANIQRTAELVENNLAVFESVTAGHSSLFPDRDKLLITAESELVAIAEGRIAKAELEEAKRKEVAEKVESEAKEKADTEALDNSSLGPIRKAIRDKDVIKYPPIETYNAQVEPTATSHSERYVTTVIITGTKDQAIDVAKNINESVKPFGDVIESVTLSMES